MSVPTDFILKDDEHLRKWIKEITDAESWLKRMQNELEVEQVKGKLIVSELEGEILKLEELVNVSMSEENHRLKHLMVNQLTEIDKTEVLNNIFNELLKQRDDFLRELPHDFDKPNERATNDEETLEILGPDEGRKEDESKIEEDIQRIEEKIVEMEKEQINLKLNLVHRHELLDELKLLEEFTNNEEPPRPESGIKISEKDDSKSSNLNGNLTNETTSEIPSEHQIMEDTFQIPEIRKGTCYGPYAIGKNSAFVLKTAKRINRVGPLSVSSKRSKLDLYEKHGDSTVQKRDETSEMKKTAPTFKPKTPSCVRRIAD